MASQGPWLLRRNFKWNFGDHWKHKLWIQWKYHFNWNTSLHIIMHQSEENDWQKYLWFSNNPSGRALALTLACYASCDRAPPEMHPLKMFEILGHPHFKQLLGHKIPMNATNSPDRLNLYIFSLNLSYHSFVSVHDIQQKQLLNKISVYAFTHPSGHHSVANATLSVACTCDGCATFRSPVTSSEVTWITWSPLWRSTHLPNSEIFIAWNNAFFITTVHVVKDAVAKILG